MPFQWVHNASPAVNAQSRWPMIVAVCMSMTTLMAVTVALRIYVRARMVYAFGVDDWIIIFAALCCIVYNGLCIGQTRWGLGLPLALRPMVNLNKYTEINFAGRPFYMTGITGFKIALCVAYLRMTNNSHHSKYRVFIWTVIVFVAIAYLAGTLVLLFRCQPVHKSWRPHTPGKCLDNIHILCVTTSVATFCDVVIFFSPIPILVKARINHRKKIGLILVFALGILTTLCSVMRMVQIKALKSTGDSTKLVLLGSVECNVGIFLTCLPFLTPLVTLFRGRGRSHIHPLSSSLSSSPPPPPPSSSPQSPPGMINNPTATTTTATTGAASSATRQLTSHESSNPADSPHITKTTVVEVARYPREEELEKGEEQANIQPW